MIGIKDFVKKVKNEEIDIVDFIKNVISKCRKFDEEHNCFVTISEDEALIQAKELSENPEGKLAGIPVTVKDAICTKNIQTSAGSRILESYKPVFDATVIKRLKDEGAIIIAKTNQDEFGFGSFSTNSGYSIPKNPFDSERTCGGSSGGSACITRLADFPHISIGESTGGSISCPASFCGVYGLTPTYGRVSRYGLIDYANSLDKIGPMAKSTLDISRVLNIISGKDDFDQTTLNTSNMDFTKFENVKNYKIGLPQEYFENLDNSVRKLVYDAISRLENLGISFVETSLEMTKYVIPAYYLIAVSEASTNLARYDGIRYGKGLELKEDFNNYFNKVRTKFFGEEAKRRIILGTFARMSGYRNKYYLRAMKIRTLIIKDFKKALKNVDCLLSPTMMFPPPKFSEIDDLNPLQVYKSDLLTVGPNLAGIPMINVPCGKTPEGLPVGFHLLSDHLEEHKILSVSNAYEENYS